MMATARQKAAPGRAKRPATRMLGEPATRALRKSDELRRSNRLVARITNEQKKLFERAAAVEGRTLSDFIVAAVQAAATKAVEDHAAIRLNVEATEAFVAEMMAPSPLPERLRETIRRYRDHPVPRR